MHKRTALLAVLAVCLTCALPAVTASPAAAFSKAIWGHATYNGVDQFPMYKQLGVSIIELDLNWSEVAPTRPAQATNPSDPAYVWPASIQQMITEAASYHMRVLLQVIGSPPWANGGHPEWGWAPLKAPSYVSFVRAAAREYPSVHLWMIWGEPTKVGNFMPMQPALAGAALNSSQRASVELYAEMLDGSYGALKAISKKNLVIGGCSYTSGAIDPLQWIENLRLPDRKPPRMDMYAHNPFSYESPVFTRAPNEFGEIQFANLPELAGLVDRYLHRGLPLFLSEWTIPTANDETFNFAVDPSVAAQWVTEALRESRAWHRIYALGWVNVYDIGPCSSVTNATGSLECGGLLSAGGSPKSDFYAFARG